MKQNSSGIAIFALIALLAIGVQWVESRFGPEMAGVAVSIVGILVVFVVLGLMALAMIQGISGLLEKWGKIFLGIQKIQGRERVQQERQETIRIKSEADMQKQIMRTGLFLGRHIGANYKAQIAAQSNQPEPVPEDNPYIDLVPEYEDDDDSDEGW